MSRISIISNEDVKGNLRLDVGYYDQDILDAIQKLEGMPHKKLDHLLDDVKSSAFYDSISFYYSSDGEMPFVRVSDIKEPFLSLDDLIFLSRDRVERQKGLSKVSNEYLLISKGGTTGKICSVWPEYSEYSISRDVIGIKPDESQIDKFFLLAFFLTKYGRNQLARGVSRQTVPHITLNILRNVIVPTINKEIQNKISNLITTARDKLKLSKIKFSEAEQELYHLLGISKQLLTDNIPIKTFATEYKAVEMSNRLDPEYYNPKYNKTLSTLKKNGMNLLTIDEEFLISPDKEDPLLFPSNEFKYIPIAKLNEDGDIFEWITLRGWKAPSRARLKVKAGDIIVPSLSGTFNKISIVPPELDGQLTSTGNFVLRSRHNYPEFNFLLLRSPLFIEQLEQRTTGEIMSAISRNEFSELLIPSINKVQQIGVVDLIKDSMSLRTDSRSLVKGAIEYLETVIENGGDPC